METKSRVKSKSYWTALIITIATLFGDNFEVLAPFFDGYADAVAQVMALIIIALRELTTQPVNPIMKSKKL